MMTVSAAVRLIPSPPARVHSKKTNRSESAENIIFKSWTINVWKVKLKINMEQVGPGMKL